MHEEIVSKLEREKKRNKPITAIVIVIVFFSYGSFVTLLMGLYKLIIVWIVLCALIVYAIVWNEKRQDRLINLVKNGKMVPIETTITSFRASSDYDSGSIDGYYIIATDGNRTYKSNLLNRSIITGDDMYENFDTLEDKKQHSILMSHKGVFYHVGDKVEVYINPDNPKDYFVNV